MEYCKLIAIKIDDFYSSIAFKANYGLEDTNKVNQKRKELESAGYVCLVAKTAYNIQI